MKLKKHEKAIPSEELALYSTRELFKRNAVNYVATILTVILALVFIELFLFFTILSVCRNAATGEGEMAVSVVAEKLQGYIDKAEEELEIVANQIEIMSEEGLSSDEICAYITKTSTYFTGEIGQGYNRIFIYIDGTIFDGEGAHIDDDFDATSRAWYKAAAKSKGRCIVTSPYVDALSGEKILSVSKMLKNGKDIVNMDIVLTDIEQFVLDIGYSGEAFIMTADGYIVAHTDENKVGTNLLDETPITMRDIMDDVLEKDHTSYKVTTGKGDFYVFSKKIKDDWYVINITHFETLLQPYKFRLFTTVFIDILVVFVVGYFLTNSFVNRYRAVIYAARQQVSNDNLIEQRNISRMLAGDYSYVYRVDLDEDTYTAFIDGGENISDDEFLQNRNPYMDFMRGHIEKYVHPDDKKRLLKSIEPEYLRNKLSSAKDFTIGFRSNFVGRMTYRELKAVPLNANEKPLRHIIIGILDADTKKKAELKVKNQEYIISNFASDFDIICFVNLNTDKMYFYQIGEHETEWIKKAGKNGYTKYLKDFADTYMSQENAEKFLSLASPEYLRVVLQNKKYIYIDQMINTPDGREIYYEVKVVRVEDDSDEIVFGARSVDDEKRREMAYMQELELTRNEAMEANKAKTTFLSNMSHDIRTPMNAIIGFANLVKKHTGDKAKVEDYIDKILISSRHLLSLVNDVLDMSRIESGNLVLDLGKCNLSEILHDINIIVRGQTDAKHQEFSVEAVNLINDAVECDRVRLNQVLINLLSNAMKFTPEGGHIRLTLTEMKSSVTGYGHYEIRVKDDGIGMSEEFVSKVYAPFAQERSSTVSKINGSGLGMSICKNIIDIMAGTIDVVTAPGEGTEFIIVIDLKLQSEKMEEVKKFSFDRKINETVEEVENYDFGGKKVLLVEDNEFNREIAREILEDYNLVVDDAEDGEIAVKKVIDSAPQYYDFVLMDVKMPVMDGYTATRKIRELGGVYTNIPIIAMTANAFENDRREAIANGMNAHLSKPIVISELVKTLKQFLG